MREVYGRMWRCLVAAALSMLLAAPAVAQTTSPSTSKQRPSTTMPGGGTGKSDATTGTPRGGQQSQVDINSAPAQELDKLPGIGQARAQAIIANRPYKSKDELAQRKIVPEHVYDQIKDKIVVRQGTASTSGAGSTRPSSGTATKSTK